MRAAIPVALALVAGATLVAFPGILRAGDETAHDAVERLLPKLMSEDDAVRGDAEKQLFALGAEGRAELERITRDADPRRAVTALRLLQDRKWQQAGRLREGEEPAQREGQNADRGGGANDRLEELRARLERQMQEIRKRFEQFDRGFTWQLPPLSGMGRSLHGSSSGTIVENDRKTSWTLDGDGRIKVTLQDGKDAAEQTYEAKSFDELKKDHPEVAERVERALPRQDGRGFVFQWGAPDRPGGVHRLDPNQDDPFQLEAPQAPVLGIEWSPVPDVLREQLDLSDGGVVVESVVHDSLAAKLGLKRYDVLVEVNGKKVAGSPDVRAALEGAKAGDTVKATIVRKGQRTTLGATK